MHFYLKIRLALSQSKSNEKIHIQFFKYLKEQAPNKFFEKKKHAKREK